jgi:hypothetical protein
MTKIDIFSGFLGAGKTTLIRKLIKEAYAGQKIVLIENEFGEIAIDGGFLKDAGVQITEMNSGCICCTLVGDFKAALEKVIDEYAPTASLSSPPAWASSPTWPRPFPPWPARPSWAPRSPWWTPTSARCTSATSASSSTIR